MTNEQRYDARFALTVLERWTRALEKLAPAPTIEIDGSAYYIFRPEDQSYTPISTAEMFK
jgi:hypothetical protein